MNTEKTANKNKQHLLLFVCLLLARLRSLPDFGLASCQLPTLAAELLHFDSALALVTGLKSVVDGEKILRTIEMFEQKYYCIAVSFVFVESASSMLRNLVQSLASWSAHWRSLLNCYVQVHNRVWLCLRAVKALHNSLRSKCQCFQTYLTVTIYRELLRLTTEVV